MNRLYHVDGVSGSFAGDNVSRCCWFCHCNSVTNAFGTIYAHVTTTINVREREREGGRRDSFMSCNLCKHVSSGVLSAEVRARLIGSREESSECTVIGYRSDEERRIERVDWPCVSRGAVA